jgi:hypothetical protein
MHKLQDPLGELVSLVVSVVSRVCENHQPVVCLASNNTSNTLRCLPNSIKVEKILFSDLIMRLQVFKPRAEYVGQGVLKGDTKHDLRCWEGTAVSTSEIHPKDMAQNEDKKTIRHQDQHQRTTARP